jgi:hypothetical protein
VYATDAEAKIILPIKLLKSSWSLATFTFHLSASPAKPPTNFYALTN